MKIAYLITRADDVGGAQVHVRDMSEACRLLGHDVTVMAGGVGTFSEELAARRIPYRTLRYLSTPIHPAKDFLALLEIARALREIKPDILATHTAKAGLLGRIAGAALGYPVVFTPHGWSISDRISPRQGRLFRKLETLASGISTRIINVCDFEVELALRCGIATKEKLVKVYNGVPDMDDDCRAEVSIQPPRIVMLARMAPPKDHAILIRALSRLKHFEWTLDFAGDGPLEAALRRQVFEAGLQDRVRFLGFREDSDSLLRSAQIFALTSRSEAFPYSILEAMRAGLPVVATSVGGIPEEVIDGETGLLAAPGDVVALEQHLARLLGDPALRRELGNRGRERFLAHFTFEKMFHKTMRVYQEAIERRGAIPARETAPPLRARPVEGTPNR